MKNSQPQKLQVTNIAFFCCLWILSAGFSYSANAKEITLVRPLVTGIEEESSRKTKTINEQLYNKLLNNSILFLFDPLSEELELNAELKQDYLTILETSYLKLSHHDPKSFSKREEKGGRFRKAFARHGQQYYLSSMDSIYESIKYSIYEAQPESELPSTEKLSFDEQAENIYQAMEELSVMMGLLLKVDDLSRKDPETYSSLKEAYFEIFRKEILNFDKQIKMVSKLNQEVAQRLAVGFVEILLNAHSPQTPQVYSSLFQPIESQQIINTMADQYITRAANWFFTKVVKKIRKSSFYVFAFGATVWAGSYLLGADVTREAYYDFIGVILPMSFVVWGGEIAGSRIAAFASPKLDFVLNYLRSLRFKNKEGPLFKEAKAHHEFHFNSCISLFEKSL